MKKLSIDETLAEANKRLKLGNLKITICMRGGKLSLQATLPPKPDSGKEKPYQQRISLGIAATIEGIEKAEKEARKLRVQLDASEFIWEEKQPQIIEETKKIMYLKDWLDDFEEYYFSKKPKNPQTLTTWKGDYLQSFRKIQGDFLTPEAIKKAILTTEPNSRSRQRICMALGALCRFAKVDVEIADLAGKYCSVPVRPRDLPSDEMIADWYQRIPDREWQWFYGVVAAYGLRPHEAFHVEGFDGSILEIGRETKTGSRLIWPFYPEWFRDWHLSDIAVPVISADNNSLMGNKAAYYFRRLNLPFHLYDLRHCWARRTLEFGLDISLAAQQMGHSVHLHSRTYHAWIGKTTHDRAFQQILKKGDRPVPPV